MKLIFKTILFVLLISSVFAQTGKRNYDNELRHQNKAINALKDEIGQLRLKLKKAESKERSTASRISSLDEDIALTSRLVQSLKREEEKTRNRIFQLKESLLKNETELDNLRIRYEERVVNSYLKGRLTDLERVFSSTTWRQAMYRTQYLKIITDIEKKMTKQIEKLLIQVSQQKLELEATLRENLNLKRDKEKQMIAYQNMRITREQELNRIRTDKKSLAIYMNEKEAGIGQLESIIKNVLEDKARFEREERIRQQQEALKVKSFKSLKGQISWPAKGRIIAKFGRQWNPKLKTTTENPGIDIKGQPGSAIRSIMGGIVTTITYIRGYGTTIIIDHGGGFYTVYSHVTNIQTSVDSEVRNGDVIAYMGDSGSINGAKLHFEIWGKGQKLDPEKWLTKK
ncbi:MAG: peptidoglycan DD-metalloendopeptidase family protein [Candidatus Marinimicrobia bacterium]|nr:peptidoglycan DD-metalloendopeptidase family protein [Candidatus Neomarinimicrobiota bacterium]MBT3840025.1 peptidoglycan DD-metalloendopeptidase family protein [Candidatus Neomarinimicrobiota bacterium]MBT4000057.1 peptidoglycan DD-metalloendopeptidase family protein [Candidatus Neomarinimicrobiota bacterium]MBT4282144.1 peptidoglycan DD-metalloendopeptidase family protein [Candidatus Neomarinimicrobiota bacterium]MBT4578883.1 peptidoglycan DD-metalloendopeptidase family protein [Candidatus